MKSKPKSKALLAATRNRKFQALSAKEKRKTIAKDVLARLDAKQYQPQVGTAIYSCFRSIYDLGEFVDQGHDCKVCVLGGAACSLAYFEDKIDGGGMCGIPIGDCDLWFEDDAPIKTAKRLRKTLGSKTCELMEFAFEKGHGMMQCDLSDEEQASCLKFSNSYKTSLQVFRAVWEQIARTGTFDPTKLPAFEPIRCAIP